MLTCSNCIRTCLRAVLSDALSPASLRVTSNFATRRHQSTAAGENVSPSVRRLKLSKVPEKKRSLLIAKKREIKDYKKVDLQKEVQYLSDPLKLADNTVRLLKEDNYDKALLLVQLAGNNLNVTVSWNHLIDYLMSKGKITQATKAYQEVCGCSTSVSCLLLNFIR